MSFLWFFRPWRFNCWTSTRDPKLNLFNFSPEASSPLTHSPTTLPHFFSPFSFLSSFFLTLSTSLWSFFFLSTAKLNVYEGIFVVVLISSYKPFFGFPSVSKPIFGWSKGNNFQFFCSSFFICIVTHVVVWRCFLLFQFRFHKKKLVFQEFRRPIIRWRKGNNFRVFFSFFFILHIYSCLCCCCLNVFFVCFYFVFINFFFVFQVLNFSPETSAPLTHSPTTLLHFFSLFSLLYSFFLTLLASLWSFFFSFVLSCFLFILKRRSKIFEDPKRSSQAEGWKIIIKRFYF